MSKYQALYNAMGRSFKWRDTSKEGFIFKWYDNNRNSSLEQRKARAAEIYEKLKHIPYVEKVVVRIAKSPYCRGGLPVRDYDKICVYVKRF